VAVTIMKDRDAALDTMAREELGLDPDQLGAPWSAAISRLLLFAMGVVVVLPFMFGSGLVALIAAIVSACVALFVVGAAFDQWSKRLTVRDTSATRWRWRRRVRFHDRPPGGSRPWRLARLPNCGYLQCMAIRR